MSKTQVRKIMMDELSKLISEGRQVSLFRLSAEALVSSYSVTWRNLRALERAGVVKVIRHKPPQPMEIEILIMQLPLEVVPEQC